MSDAIRKQTETASETGGTDTGKKRNEESEENT